MRFLLVFVLLVLVGCNKVDESIDSIKDTVGLGPTEEEIQKEKQAEKDAVELAHKQLRDSDELVDRWASKLDALKNEDGTYLKYEALTEEDSWGNYLEVEYSDSDRTQSIIIRSSGPDKIRGSADDLVRTRTVEKNLSFFEDLKISIAPHMGLITAWVVGGAVFGLLFIPMQNSRRRKSKGTVNGPLVFFLCVLAAPVALVVFVLMIAGSLISGDIDFDIDLDFD